MSSLGGELRPQADQPSRTDRFVRTVSQRLGGPVGRHGAPGSSWWNPLRVALLTATAVYLVGVLFRLPCRQTVAGQVPNLYQNLCYSDIGILYGARGLLEGNTPYLDAGDYPVLEYPVLTGAFLELERLITVALGAPTGPGLSDQSRVDATLIFVDVNTVLLGVCLLITVWAQLRSVPHRPWDAMMIAASPCVAAAALINWDLLAIALTAVGVLCWSRRQPGWAGVFWGLGMAAKLYPLFLLGPLLLLCVRSGRLRAFGTMLVGFLVSWALVNVPVMILAPDSWLSFWRYNSGRGGDLGSIWYVLSLAGWQIANVNLLALGLFGLGCLAIAALIVFAPRRPRLGAVMFLVMAAFLLTNKVYSPQYMLWLLPFVVLARPVWRDWLIFTVGEMFYFVAIWWHLGGLLTPGAGSADRVYWLAVLLRMATQTWLVIMVVRDAWRPEHDVVRRGDVESGLEGELETGLDGAIEGRHDDPTGGVLDGAPDASWFASRQPSIRR